MEGTITTGNEQRIDRLERRVRLFERGFSIALAVLLVAVLAGMRNSQQRRDVLRVRGLIVEDAQGKARILLGAPVPKVADRKRQDDATGMIVLGDTGSDRVTIGAPTPSPQIAGSVRKRNAESAGIIINDLEGNERGGFGYLDNGVLGLGLDYPLGKSEAVVLFVLPSGSAGMVLNGQQRQPGLNAQRAGLVVDNNTGSVELKLTDSNRASRAVLSVKGDSAARLMLLDPATKQQWDVLEKLRQ
jgi:hypothetical protein